MPMYYTTKYCTNTGKYYQSKMSSNLYLLDTIKYWAILQNTTCGKCLLCTSILQNTTNILGNTTDDRIHSLLMYYAKKILLIKNVF